MYKLVIQDDEGKTTVVPLIRDELTIGRKEGNTIRLTERNVSRRHARLVRSNGSITIEDLNSYNGIRVNGSRIQGRVQIRETDRVQIGDYLIELKSVEHDKADTLSERTIPLERIDPHASTPVPDSVEPSDSSVATTRMSKSEAAAVLGAGFVGAVTEPIAPLSDTDPGAGPVTVPPPGAAPGVPPPVAPAAHPVAHARVVVLSTNLAGREFELDKPAMVIGRTEDNDVCINHRSISRHHAKVVRENGRYAIVDLQSSNGVRVNGEEYGKVELRRADVIDLGHVRLRFVEAGEDFLFGRDAQAVEVVPQGSSRVAMWVALALLVIGGAVVLFLVLGGRSQGPGGDDEQEVRAGTRGSSATQPKPTVAAVDDPAPGQGDEQGDGPGAGATVTSPAGGADAGPAPSSDDVAKVSKLLDGARQAVDDEKWNDVLTAAGSALEVDPSNADAKGFADQAKSEMAMERIHKQFVRAVSGRDFARVADLYRRLDPESVYRVKAQPDHERLKNEYVAGKGREGKRLAEKSRCREQQRLADEAGRAWIEANRAVLSHACKLPATGGVAQNGGGKAPPSEGGDGEQGGKGADGDGGDDKGGGEKSGGEEGGGASFDELFQKARAASMAGEYQQSLRFCDMAAEKRRNDQRLMEICAVASCKANNSVKAKRYINKISDENKRELSRSLCSQSGITGL